jgi:hypothetical protein
VVERYRSDIRAAFAGSVPYLMLAGSVHGGWQMARAALAAHAGLRGEDAAFCRAKIATARYFADHVLASADGLRAMIVEGAVGTLALAPEHF